MGPLGALPSRRNVARSALVHKTKVKGGTSWAEGLGQDLRAEPRDMWGNFKSE